jgi:hypothetical protein
MFDEHDSGQLRIGAAGDQVSLLPLADAAIPASDGPALASPACETVDGLKHGDTFKTATGARFIVEAPYSGNLTRAEADAEARNRLTRGA